MLVADHVHRHRRAKLFFRILIACLAVALNSIAQSACSPAGDINRNLSRLMARYHAIGQFHGTVLVARGDDIVFEQGFGEANREWGNPNGIDTKFRLGSVTKSITATLALNLVDEGLVDLSETVSRYLPDFREDVGAKVTIRHLLTHSSGIALPAMSMDEYWNFFQRRLSTDDILEQLCSGDLRFEPVTGFSTAAPVTWSSALLSNG
jgi:CubicO group peptidase (beta-lactamase class C family)